MTHFAAYVLVPEGTPDIGYKVGDLLWPHSDGLEVPEYERECDCVRYAAILKVRELASEKFGPVEKLGEQFYEMMKGKEDADPYVEWEIFMKDYDEFTRDQYQRLVEEEPPDLMCEECSGSGRVMSAFNPAAKFDYWEIGGGWESDLHGSICNLERASFKGAAVPLKDLDQKKLPTPSVIVTPDGEWHEPELMGMVAGIRPPDGHWNKKVGRILEEHQDSILVVVDCHS